MAGDSPTAMPFPSPSRYGRSQSVSPRFSGDWKPASAQGSISPQSMLFSDDWISTFTKNWTSPKTQSHSVASVPDGKINPCLCSFSTQLGSLRCSLHQNRQSGTGTSASGGDQAAPRWSSPSSQSEDSPNSILCKDVHSISALRSPRDSKKPVPAYSGNSVISENSVIGDSESTVTGATSGKCSEPPIDRLMRAVKSMSAKSLRDAIGNIASVVSTIDRFAGPAGDDLAATTRSIQMRSSSVTRDESGVYGTEKMRCGFNVVSSLSSNNGSETPELELTATSGRKRPRLLMANHAFSEEIRQINRSLIDTVVDISDEDTDKGTIVKCSYAAVALSPNLKSLYASPRVAPIQPLRLLVPTNYPICAPIILDKFPVKVGMRRVCGTTTVHLTEAITIFDDGEDDERSFEPATGSQTDKLSLGLPSKSSSSSKSCEDSYTRHKETGL